MRALYQDALESAASDHAAFSENMSSTGDIAVTSLFITNRPDSSKSNIRRTRPDGREINTKTDNGCAVELALEKSLCGDPAREQKLRQAARPQGRADSHQETHQDTRRATQRDRQQGAGRKGPRSMGCSTMSAGLAGAPAPSFRR
ncbi:hypothetical protein V6L77_01505 [Pannonibacter sp. Pt2-lr]